MVNICQLEIWPRHKVYALHAEERSLRLTTAKRKWINIREKQYNPYMNGNVAW